MTKIYIYLRNVLTLDISKLKEELPVNVLNHIEKYKQEIDYTNSLIAWHILKKQLKEDFNETLNIVKFNEYGKPLIENLSFNISHSNNIIVVGISNKTIGIDIEMEKTINQEEKIKQLLNLNSSYNSLIEEWTKYEATIKYYGLAIFKKVTIPQFVKSIKLNDYTNNTYYLSYCVDDTNIEIKTPLTSL